MKTENRSSEQADEGNRECAASAGAALERAAIALLEEMIAQQQRKVIDLGRAIYPRASPEDIMNPHDVPALETDPRFNYEEGMLAGYLAVRIALSARVFRPALFKAEASGGSGA